MKAGTPHSELGGSGLGPEGRAVSVFGRGRKLASRGAGQGMAALTPEDLALLAHLRPHYDPDQLWQDLPAVVLDPDQAHEHHLIATHHLDSVGLLYDHLRTRLLQALSVRGWGRVAVSAPTRGCGASTVAANLALSLARRPSGRTILVDLDLRQPRLASMFGLAEAGRLRPVLTAERAMDDHLCRLGGNLGLVLNDQAEIDAAELLQEPSTAAVFGEMIEDYAPDVVIYDLPPILDSDDVLGFLPLVDGILLVADGTRNTVEHIRECERLILGQTELLGVVMNRAEDSPVRKRHRR